MRPSLEGTMPSLPPLIADRKVAAARSVGWRTLDEAQLRRRRQVIALYTVANLSMSMAALYQTGILDRLPDLPLERFDAQAIESSAEGYQVLGVPDAVLSLFNNSATMLLATLGGPGRGPRGMRALLAAKVSVDAAYIAKLTFNQAARHNRFCWQCLLAGGAIVAALPAAWRQAS